MFGILGGMSLTQEGGKAPRYYNFGDFWTSSFCPNCKVTSFPFVMWIINTVVYFATLITVFIEGSLYEFIFLGPKPAFLNTVQAMNPYEVRHNYQLWRPITSLFLTAGFYEYAIMTAYLLLFGFMLQATGMSFFR